MVARRRSVRISRSGLTEPQSTVPVRGMITSDLRPLQPIIALRNSIENHGGRWAGGGGTDSRLGLRLASTPDEALEKVRGESRAGRMRRWMDAADSVYSTSPINRPCANACKVCWGGPPHPQRVAPLPAPIPAAPRQVASRRDQKLSLGDPTVQKRVLAILSHVNKAGRGGGAS